MPFHNIRFPVEIALASEGGPERRTEIVELASGREQRNALWADSRRRYNAGYGVRAIAEMEQVVAFFEARCGRLHAFRWRDPFDWKSCPLADEPAPTDQPLGTGDGSGQVFQLVKAYDSGGESWMRRITRPVADTVTIAVDGNPLPPGQFSTDALTGEVTLAVPPDAGALITAGFEFDVPVRFDTDSLSLSLAALKAGEIPSIPLVEVRD